MAQHDYNIANQSGADFRSDLNDALSAIASTNSGDTAPGTTFANQLWIDTANNLLKIRNEANSAWITTGIDITADNTFTSVVINTSITGSAILDDDTFATASATTVATSESIKAYVDSQVGTVDTLAEILANGNTTDGTDISLSSSDITGTGNINITGTIQSSGNITGTLATAAQTNITSVGTLSSLTVLGDLEVNGSDITLGNQSSDQVTIEGTAIVGTTSTTIDSSNHGILLSNVGRIKNSVNVAGGGVVFNAFGTAGEFRVKGDGDAENTNNSYGAISDERLKENIADATPKLEKLKQVQVKTFNLIDHDLKQIGVIAQDLESVFPSLVKDNDDGYKTVKYSVFVPILIKAIQELEQQVADLTQRLDGE